MQVVASTEQSAHAVRCQFLLSTNGTVGKKNGKWIGGERIGPKITEKPENQHPYYNDQYCE